MTSTITFDALLDEINTGYDHPQTDRNKYENWLFNKFGECIEVNVIRWRNKQTQKKIKIVESFVQVHPTAKAYLSPSVQGVLLDFDVPVSQEILKVLNVAPEQFLSFQKPLKQASDTVLVLSSSHWSKISFEELRFVYFSNRFLELEKQCYTFLKETINACKEKHLYSAIRKIQRTLLTWSIDVIQLFHLDRLTRSRSIKLYDKTSIFALGYDCLENILVHLERFYSKYLDRELFVPFNVISSRVNCLKPRVERLKLNIISQYYDAEFLEALFQPLLLVSNVNPKNRLTYHQLMFIECFTNKLLRFFAKENQKANSIELLHGYLIEMNYNNPSYFTYLAFKFSEELSKLPSLESKQHTLYSWLKSVNQIVASNEVQYDRNVVSLKSSVIGWLEEEIWFLKSTCPVHLQLPNEPSSANVNQSEKVKMNCSVSELALLVRMLSETDLVSSKTHRELMEQITDNFQTSKVQDISIKSLSNKYYEPDTNTINAIKEKVIQMLNKLNHL
ncbi:hypothetical protein [Fluviicola taffensis]|uniref:Uncharacterized protein n=1 Tax=Fluviicola taffensis (strain DSM 16823 / NCIMB 13979 / RW262) TaxID=755732 RepID=F2IJ83_FLUTR|nr:hypothetical protein [Fluviicola taffensis]AEA44953.1 hypothetical protein Fluta_2974 [Fluviicola taffensis DSM 16823]